MALDFEHLLGLHTGERQDYLPICRIDLLVAAARGATTDIVFLSRQTIQKQLSHHKELPISAYRALAACLAFGEYRQDTPRTAVVLFVDTVLTDSYYRAAIKATEAGDEIFLTSFLPVRTRAYRAELRKPHPVLRPHLEI
jgi:hypothetical protein